MPSPTLENRSLGDLVAVLSDLGLIGGASTLLETAELLVGWESAVVRSADGWIYRFGRKDEETFRRELEVLALVDGRLGVATPHIEAVDHPNMLMVDRTLTGAALDLPLLMSQVPAQREALTRSLAHLLAAMHDLGETALGGMAVPVLNAEPMVQQVLTARPGLDRPDQLALDELVTAWESSTLSDRPETLALLHGDFHFGNMVLSQPTGPVIGIWDFTCVELGDPSADLRYLSGDSPELAKDVASAYVAITGRRLDCGAARLMLTLEDVADAIAEHRSVGETIARWR